MGGVVIVCGGVKRDRTYPRRRGNAFWEIGRDGRPSSVTVFYLLQSSFETRGKVGKACHVPSIFSYKYTRRVHGAVFTLAHSLVNKGDSPLSFIELHR